jgi:hypothetical protein
MKICCGVCHYTSYEETVNLKLVSGCLAISLVQVTAVEAQPASPSGHYTKKRDGAGEMRVEKTSEGWRVFVSAGGVPRGGATAADCTLNAVGEIKGNTFQGEIKNQPAPDEKPGPDNAVVPGHKMTITFAPQIATLTAADVDTLCGQGTGIFGRYTKRRK